MYYRYKVKKKRKGYLKGILVILLAGLAIYGGYHFRTRLAFWRFTFNKLELKIQAVDRIQDMTARREQLEQLAEIADRYRDEHEGDVKACLMAGRVHYMYGESLMGKPFSEAITGDDSFKIEDKARKEFLKAIRLLKKGFALQGGEEPEGEYALVLARSAYFSSFETPREIYDNLIASIPADSITAVEDVRFVAVMLILAGKYDMAFEYLASRGLKNDEPANLMFLAACYRMASQYTSAIMTYQDIVRRSQDPMVRKVAYTHLGRIYYNQSLYAESIESFTRAFEMDGSDLTVKIWIGRNYLAQGNRERARVIWQEVLDADRENAEVKELLQVM